ncbi:MAG TPA: hypothetical protein PKU97_02790 [Kofleriaceae bacterium]|nr:hypothetical protein [Kofleriaceae bacterium]
MRSIWLTCALFLLGPVGCDGDDEDAIAGPSCGAPAPLLGMYDARAPGFIIAVQAGLDVTQEVGRLTQAYGFKTSRVFTSISAFAAELTDDQVARLRCDSAIQYVQHDSVSSPNAR